MVEKKHFFQFLKIFLKQTRSKFQFKHKRWSNKYNLHENISAKVFALHIHYLPLQTVLFTLRSINYS